MIELRNVSKKFVLHNQDSAVIPVVQGAELLVRPGECVALTGNSGIGISTLMRMVYGNYWADNGAIIVDGVNLVQAAPRDILRLRRQSLGYLSQFLRVVSRVSALEVAAENLLRLRVARDVAMARAEHLLSRLNLPHRLWSLSPTAISGGEPQRVNIAREFAHGYPALLLDEPTASLDPANRAIVLSMIGEAKVRGAAVLGIYHDTEAHAQVCGRSIDMSHVAPEAA